MNNNQKEKTQSRYQIAFNDLISEEPTAYMQSLYDSSNYTKHYDFCRDYCPFDNCLYNCFASLEEDLEQEKLSG